MKLVAGLGNFEEKYLFTRHNAGFMAVDFFVLFNNQAFKTEKKLKSAVAKFKFNEACSLKKQKNLTNISAEG